MMKTVIALLAVVVTWPTVASAQATDYTLRIYTAGTSTVVSTNPIPSSAVTCNQAAPPASASTKNPNKVVFDDPANAGRVCVYTDPLTPTSPLGSLKVGNYEGTVASVVAGSTPPLESEESNRAPFSRTPPAPTNARLVK